MATSDSTPEEPATVGPAVGGAWLSRLAALTTAHAARLWVAVIVGLVLDAALTVYGIRLGLTESNPVAADLIARVGVVPALALLKGASLAVAVGGWFLLPERYRGLVPAGLAIPWIGAAAVNVLAVGVVLV
ncbi:DUF5658 family protein [Haloplanus salilacus]|uniref:DUF5658 family protein n=1 Tax=Haloplanus salilacus TaxID=2949994 RepID=UPI0030CD832B